MTGAAAGEDARESLRPIDGARFAVVVLTAMNLLNYFDRYVPSAVKELLKADLHLTDKQTSLPLTAFVTVYLLASPVFGTLAERRARHVLIAAGVAVWSLATAAAAFATGFWSLLAARALVGVGEAAYATIAPALLADFYPPSQRNRILTIFYVAIPVGAALGFSLGGAFGARWGWRVAFLLCGLPGLVAAGSALLMKNPGRGNFESARAEVPGWRATLTTLRATPAYVIAVLGYTFVTFGAGGMGDWLTSWLVRTHGLPLAQAGRDVGIMTVVGGLGGTLAGGFAADRLRGRTRNAYFALSALSMAAAAIFAGVGVALHGTRPMFVCLLIAQVFLWCYNGPINTILANSVPGAMRARAFSVSILCIHLFGDALSPTVLGVVSDRTGSLQAAVWIVPAALALGAVAWAVGWRRA